MKNVLVIIVLMIFSSQLFAQNETSARQHSDITISKGKEGTKCPEYLDCPTGQIKYFEYNTEFIIDAPEVCGPLGVQSFSIKKGQYEVLRSGANKDAVVTLAVMRWTPLVPKPQQPITYKSFTIDGINPKGKECIGYGNSCWFATNSGNDGNEKRIPIIITPIMENDRCVAIQLQYKGSGSPKNLGF